MQKIGFWISIITLVVVIVVVVMLVTNKTVITAKTDGTLVGVTKPLGLGMGKTPTTTKKG